jgi:rhodanese-related sulfurtransferase
MHKLLALLFILFSFNTFAADPKTAYSLSQKNEAVMIDVREEDEIQSGMVKGAKWFPLSKIENDKNWKKEFTKLAGDKKIFLYCRSGRRSEKVLNILKDVGIESKNIGGYETLKTILPVEK